MHTIAKEIRDLLATSMAATAVKKFYVGKVKAEKIPTNYLPALMVYCPSESLVSDQLTTARDKFVYEIVIEIVSNAYKDIDAANGIDTDGILNAQKTIRDLVSAKDSTTKVPNANTVLGTLRRNITGTDFLFNNDYVANIDEENISGTTRWRAIITLSATTKLRNRS